MARVIRPGGLALIAFQVGDGPSDVGSRLRARGHDVTLVRHERTVEAVLDAFDEAGFATEARLARQPVGAERQPQAVLILRFAG